MSDEPNTVRSVPTAAGVYDWLLGGHHHQPCDAEAAVRALQAFPALGLAARVNREFLHRTVRYLGSAGIRQFLDIGSGYPAMGSVHEVAHAWAPRSRVAYVDHDPDTVAVSRELLAGTPDTIAIGGDLREPDAIFADPEVRAVLNFEQPVGLLLISVLPFLDGDAAELVAAFRARLAPGSHLVISHITESDDPIVRYQQQQATKSYNGTVRQQARTRTREEITALFAGTELVPPGLVHVPDWRPTNPRKHEPDDRDESRVVQLGGVGRVLG
ncbi:hypothetical protein FPZ12_020665 [Amycolatopsis acidicola]|uniref:SAM-dependent methyltransferase n=1 Tax=Amycolatopsis acidicola TaxID=2596893 RepID=A0A5N0UZE2_9PSEU|nr:SAM-dependent methyltransferase [Amycolatopsis acidicola]KAA9159317.1 hypothetical protein FPZ12_020665 [Amycolatopsis acidicola]